MQVAKLQALPLDEKVKQILALISTKRFQYVIQLIEQRCVRLLGSLIEAI
jgi:hypothetical protein